MSKSKTKQAYPNAAARQKARNRRAAEVRRIYQHQLATQDFEKYVLTTLFIKHVSDVWRARQERPAGPPCLVIDDGADFDSLFAKHREEGNYYRFQNVINALVASNRDELTDVFRDVDFDVDISLRRDQAQRHDARLSALLAYFADPLFDFRNDGVAGVHAAGGAFQHLLSRFAAPKDCGRFHQPTPEIIRHLMAKLLDPKPRERVFDPACGSAGLLVQCKLEMSPADADSLQLHGQATRWQWALARMNLLLHGCFGARIALGDSLRAPATQELDQGLEQFDIVLSAPPFAEHDQELEDVRSDAPPRLGAYVLLTHMLARMRPLTGRMAVVVPESMLETESVNDDAIFSGWINDNLLDAVITLPPGLFYEITCPSWILVFRRVKSDDKVMLIELADDEERREIVKLTRDDITCIVDVYQNRDVYDDYARPLSGAEMMRFWAGRTKGLQDLEL